MFALFNTSTEKVEAVQAMTFAAATIRNDDLRKLHEPVRWVPQSDVPRDRTGEN